MIRRRRAYEPLEVPEAGRVVGVAGRQKAGAAGRGRARPDRGDRGALTGPRPGRRG